MNRKPKEMRKSEILRACVPLIERGKCEFICHAISRIAGNPNAAELRHWISHDLLDGCSTYVGWLREKHPKLYAQILPFGINPFREGRLQWLQWMIAYWEKHEGRAKK